MNNCRHSEDVGVRCVASDPGPSVLVVPVVSVRDAQGDEGGTLAFVVVLSSAAAVTVTVEYATSDGTAVADADYEAVSGTLVFGPGETQKTVAVSVLADTHSEAAETLTLTLAGPVGGTLGEAQATGTIAANVHGVPLTATLTHMPDEDEDDVLGEHKGSGTFEVRLAFNTEPHMSYKTVRDTMFDVTGGTITGARRVTRRKNQHFDIVVKPSGSDAVTFSLHSPLPACGETGSVCTAAKRMIEGPVSATILGPVAISVADASVTEGAGAQLAFAVTLDRARDAAVTVDYATSDGSARAGADYTATSGTLSFAAGETAKTVDVAVVNDAHDDGTETMRLTLTNASGARIADGTATGTIENSDPMPMAWMVRFGRTVGGQVVDALTQRLEDASRSHVTVAGIPLGGEAGREPLTEPDDSFGLPQWAKRGAREEAARDITVDDLLLGSAFHLSGGAGEGASAAFTAWGRVATGGFDAEVDDVTFDGDVTTGLVGFDAEWERALAGVMLTQSVGDGSYRMNPQQGDDSGTVESDLTGVYPYARVDLNARVSAWGLAGVGRGSITLRQEGRKAMETALSMRMGALGVRGQVLDGSGPSGVGVNVKSDAMWVATKSARSADMVGAEGDVTRLRFIVQGERTFESTNGGSITPSAEVGLRFDGGDAETGAGLEVGAGLRYTRGGVSVEGQARALLAHEASGYDEWGMSGALRVNPSASGRGLTLSIAPAWGRTGSAAERLWSARDASVLEGGAEFEADGRLVAEMGYGVALGGNRGVLTPFGGLTLGDEGSRTMRSGARWALGFDLAMAVEATRGESDTAEVENEVRLRVALRF